MKLSIPSIFMFVLMAAALPVSAVTLNVPNDYVTIQSAIDDCNNGDVVIVQPGIYKENINFSGKNITVRSVAPEDTGIVASTIIDANGYGSVITFSNNESSQAVLTGFTIKGGYGTVNTVFSEDILGSRNLLLGSLAYNNL
jgi:regulator of RNase E activity RraA